MIFEKLNYYKETNSNKIFVVESDHEKKNETALNWSRQSENYSPILYSNDPVKIKIIGYESRKNNIVWKAEISIEKYIVDIRHSTIIDILQNGNIVNGEIKDDFIWIKDYNTLNLHRVGSSRYKYAVIETDDYIKSLNQPKITKDDYIPGQVFQMKSGYKYIYLGNISGTEIKTEWSGKWNTEIKYIPVNFKNKRLFCILYNTTFMNQFETDFYYGRFEIGYKNFALKLDKEELPENIIEQINKELNNTKGSNMINIAKYTKK